ncbi:MAG: aminoacetone oxidase family FAD-binding enzyme [Clostridia bacterium]|nr:aminoacetone oxidase family FAD-binding enzyme [Clostridia bacterium]MBR0406542.1 aminoacetone oxidase family FAD-binding enzyme [Clostridia bacterium]
MNGVIIIGGGAAGLTAALSASKHGAAVTVLEAAPRVGRKILASGNGRCNLANLGAMRYNGDTALAESVLGVCPVGQVLAFFHGLGLMTVEEAGRRVYPACGQAAAVLDVLRLALDQQGVAVVCDAPVTRLEKTKAGFRIYTSQKTYEARAVVAACGGMAGGKLGHDGGAYRLLTGLGHTLVSPRPALTALVTEKKAVKGLSGLRLPARLTICDGTKPIEAAQGEALFTDYGVSGVCAMQLSRKAGEMLGSGKRPMLYLDFSSMLGLVPRVYDRVDANDPFANVPLLLACLKERQHNLPKEALLTGLAPRLLAERLKGLPLPEMAKALAAFPAPVTGVRGMENAQVTAGGIRGSEFDSRTMQSRKCPGLFAAGEMLDVDGDCGGYNLQFAFASGLIAGENTARSIRNA